MISSKVRRIESILKTVNSTPVNTSSSTNLMFPLYPPAEAKPSNSAKNSPGGDTKSLMGILGCPLYATLVQVGALKSTST